MLMCSISCNYTFGRYCCTWESQLRRRYHHVSICVFLRTHFSMKSSNTLSLSGKVVSKYHHLQCSMVLMNTRLGLCLQWQSTGDHSMKNEEHLGSVIVTNIQTSGTLYPVKMDSVMEMGIFGKVMSIGNSKDIATEPMALLVVCGTGEVMAAHLKLPGYLVALCHISRPVVWAGILEVSGTSAVVVVGKGAALNIGKTSSVIHTSVKFCGKYGKSSLFWQAKTLTVDALTCYGQKDVLLFSDGFVCWLCQISFMSKNQVELKYHKVPVSGVIEVTCENIDHVEMLTFDGRKYQCSLKVLREGNKVDSVEMSSKLIDKEGPHTMEDIMTSIQHCSELMNTEGKAIHTLDMYIKQLNIAQRLLTEPQSPVFSTNVRVEQCISQRYSYFVSIQFSKKRSDLDLDGRWWRLCMIIPGANGKKFISTKLDSECFKTDVCMCVELPKLNLSKNPNNITVESYMVLDHFLSHQPVCRVFACQTKIDIIHFLEYQRNLSTAEVSSQNSFKLIHTVLQGKDCASFKSNLNRGPTPYCKVYTSYVNHDKITSLFGTLLNFTPPASPRNKASDTATHPISLWYHDNRIDIHCSREGDRTHLTLEGHNPLVVLALKAAVERRVTELSLPPIPMKLTPAVLRQAHLTHRLLNYEADVARTPEAISHLHHSVTYLLSLLPNS